MKNQMELKELGLVELNEKEMTTIEGGSFWETLFLVGWCLCFLAFGILAVNQSSE